MSYFDIILQHLHILTVIACINIQLHQIGRSVKLFEDPYYPEVERPHYKPVWIIINCSNCQDAKDTHPFTKAATCDRWYHDLSVLMRGYH